MPPVNKVIVTNIAALKTKYQRRYHHVQDALLDLVRADAARGVETRVVGLDDRATMRRFRGAHVADPGSGLENKRAIDAVWRHFRPNYLLILGAPDIVPHQNLVNPVYLPGDDDDQFAPSDLPYACEHEFSQNIADFRGPTRVVGRLPDLHGFADTFYLARLLRTAARCRVRPIARYMAYFGLTAQAWRKSTELSLLNTFGPTAVHRSPFEGPDWRRSQLGARTHFINCHGGLSSNEFFGQRGESYPVAVEADRLAGKIRSGTVVAAECCYGAQLHDPAITDGDMGICNRYLGEGAYAFFGSSTIAYGPSEGNGSADLICQFFVQRVLAGASTGRATLEARLQFAQHATHLDPTDLKTLAQFNLMGDPSIHVVGKPQHALQRSKGWHQAFDGRAQLVARELRRKRLLRDGNTLGATIGAATTGRAPQAPKHVRVALEKAIRDAGLPPGGSLSFGVHDPALTTIGVRLRNTKPTAFHVQSGSARSRAGFLRQVIVVATVQDGEIVRLRRLHRRGG
jgi:hypothetical protein